jgi:hypothetical protein
LIPNAKTSKNAFYGFESGAFNHSASLPSCQCFARVRAQGQLYLANHCLSTAIRHLCRRPQFLPSVANRRSLSFFWVWHSLRASMWALFKEFLKFCKQEKKWWLIPLVVLLLVLGAILLFAGSSGIAWALYPFM